MKYTNSVIFYRFPLLEEKIFPTWILSFLLIDPLSLLQDDISIELLCSEDSCLVIEVGS